MSRPGSSPLLVWILLFSLSAAGLVAAEVYARTIYEPRDRSRLALARLDSLQLNPADLNIIFLGNSLLRSALPDLDPVLSDTLNLEFEKRACHARHVKAINLSYPGCTLSSIRNYYGKIVALHPNALVVQVDLVVPWREPRGTERIQVDMQNVSNLLRMDLVRGFYKLSRRVRKPVDRYLPAILKSRQQVDDYIKREPGDLNAQAKSARLVFGGEDELENKLDIIERGVANDDRRFVFSQSFIQSAEEAGIDVIIVEPPRNVFLTAQISADLFDQRTRAVKRLFGNSGVSYCKPSHAFPDNFFQDSRHTNSKGMAAFVFWFSKSFVQDFIEKHPCPI